MVKLSAGIMDLISHRFDKYSNRPEWESTLLSNYHYVLFKKKKKKKKKRGSFDLNVNEEITSAKAESGAGYL